MNIAIDIDGTITSNPDVFKYLIHTLRGANHSIMLLTSAVPEDGKERITANPPERIKQLTDMGYEYVPHIMQVEAVELERRGWMKAEACRDNCIDIVFENDDHYLTKIRKYRPHALLLKVF